jgi:hypothetical protein
MIDPKMTMEVPAQVREFAEKNMDTAEKAFSSFMESASKSVAVVPGPMTDVAKHAPGDLGNESEVIVRACPEAFAGQGHKRSDATSVRVLAKSVWGCDRAI